MKKIKLKYTLFFIFLTGFISAAYQLGIIKQLALGRPFASITMVVNIIVTLTLAALGVGAFLSSLLKKNKFASIAGFGVFSILAGLWFLLSGLPLVDIRSPAVMVLVILVLGLPLVIIGILIAQLYLPYVAKRKKLGELVMAQAVGFGLGQVLALAIIRNLGANVLFVLIAALSIYFVVNKKRQFFVISIFFVLLMIVAGNYPLDSWLETMRAREVKLWPNAEGAEKVFSGWSPYAKIDFYKYDGDCLGGVYNYSQQWMACSDPAKDFKLRQVLYPELKGDVLVIGSGGGMGLIQLNNADSITAVEIDPVVVKELQTNFKEFNQDIYNRVHIIPGDGRAWLDATKEKYDYIIFEGIDFTFASKAKIFIEVENYLFTREGIRRAISRLKDKGVLIYGNTPNELPILKAIAALPDEVYYDFRRFHSPAPTVFNGLIFSVAVDEESLEQLRSIYDGNTAFFSKPINNPALAAAISDNRPFLYLKDRKAVRPLIGAVIVLGIIALGIARKKAKFELYFFALGAGLVLVELFYLVKLRSFLGDYINTFVVFSIIFFSGFAGGGYYYERLRKHIRLTPLGLLISLGLFMFIPWAAPLWFKILWIIVLVAPGAILSGIYFPLGLRRISEKQFPSAYFLDAIGSAAGFFLFYGLSVFVGVTSMMILAVVIYSFLAWVILKR